MPLHLVTVAVLTFAAPAASPPIYVTGHPWAPFVSPMGEPFRARDATDDALADWFRQADRDHDGLLSVDEMVADAERFFGTLDVNHDGQIDPDELDRYEWEVAPEIQVNSRTRRPPGQRTTTRAPAPELDEYQASDRPKKRREEDDSSLGIGGALQGGARYGLLNIPEPVAAADTDFNRAVSLQEFRQAAISRFQLLDTAHQGRLALAQLEAMRAQETDGRRKKRNDRAPDARVGNPLPSIP